MKATETTVVKPESKPAGRMFLRAEEKITQVELCLAHGDIEDAVTWAAMLLEQLRSAEWYVLNNNPKKAAAMMGYEPEMAEEKAEGRV